MLVALLSACSTGTGGLRTGDLLFCATTDPESVDTAAGAIAASVGRGGIDFVHVAILEVDGDEVWVIDATMKRGVDRHPLDTLIRDFTSDGGQKPILVVKRLKEGFSPVFIDNARRHLGEPYDFWFQPDNGRMYCSELVQESYLREDGSRLFGSRPMNFKDFTGAFAAYWVTLFERLGSPFPQGAPGTNPQDMADSPLLEEIPMVW